MMQSLQPVNITVHAYPIRIDKQPNNDHLTPERIEDAVVDFDKLTIKLSSGTQARFNPFYRCLNEHTLKPSEYKPIWLHRFDDFVWYEALNPFNPSSTRYVRSENNTFIDHKTGKAWSKDAVELIEPIKKLLRCVHTVITPNGEYFRSTRFVHETPNFYIYRKIDGTKFKYPKKTTQNEPIGFIDLNDDDVLFLYPSEAITAP